VAVSFVSRDGYHIAITPFDSRQVKPLADTTESLAWPCLMWRAIHLSRIAILPGLAHSEVLTPVTGLGSGYFELGFSPRL